VDSSRWERIQILFHEAANLPQPEQRSFLESASAGDEGLAADVLALLQEDARGATLLDQPLAEVAHKVLDAEVPASLPFQELGPYSIRAVLGEGGMGVVYLAERRDLGSRVALKLLRDAWLSPARRERFAAEQRTLAQLNHPSIARLYDADTLSDGTPFFVMEYVEGLPLTEYCVKHQCSIERRLQLFRQVCEAVQYAHGNAVIHRDLKPSNILVKSDGTVRLLDFGIAKQLESLDVPAQQTMTGLRLMTPAYAAPEQIRGQRVGIQSDVYSLGVILYELLSERLPFDLSNLAPAEAETVLLEHEPPKPSVAAQQKGSASCAVSLSAAAWADLDVLCLTAMHKDPERRYRSVEALMRDVDNYLNREPLEARPDTVRYRLSKFVRRNRREVVAASAVLAVVIGMVIFFTVRLARARDAAVAEAARTQRIQRFMISVFQGGDEAAGPAADLKVVDMIGRGVRDAQALSADPKVRAELLYNFGGIYQQLGQLDKADSLFQSALAQRRSLFGADSAEVAETLVALGLLRFDQSRLDEAEQLIRQGLEMSKRHLPSNHPVVAKAAISLGKVLGERGSHDQAIQVIEEEVRQQQSVPGTSPNELADSLSELAAAQYRAGHYDIADPLYRRLLEMHRKLYGAQHPLVADDLHSLASIQSDLGYYGQAEQFARQALAITEAYYGKDNPRVADDLTSLGQALSYENKFDEAITVLERALAIKEHAYGPVHSSVADTLNEIGNVEYQRNQWDAAEASFRRVVDIYRAVYGDHHFKVGIALSNVASTYLDRKDYARAEQIYRDVVRRNTEALSADNVNTGIARIKLGRTLLRENHYAEAEVESLAGYNILIKYPSPESSFIRAARKDLIADYEGMKQPEKAAKYRAELAAAEAQPAETARKN
jgi:serine/threonine protein kinase/tetratricopeptide (TPR) repeat protein